MAGADEELVEATEGAPGEEAAKKPGDKGKGSSTTTPDSDAKAPCDPYKPTWLQWVMAGLLSLVAALIAAGVPYLLWQGLKQAKTDTAIVLPLMGLGGMLSLLASLTVASVVFKALGLSDKDQPIGLPLGTVRATITLSLIGAFVLMAVFFYGDISTARITEYSGITQKQLDDIPKGEVVSIKASPQTTKDDKGQDVTQTVYAVERTVEKSAAGTDMAKQALTAVTTLMTTAVGFYVGTRATAGKEKKDDEKKKQTDGQEKAKDESGNQPPAKPQNEARGTNA